MDNQKPSWKSTEFWGKILVMLLGALLASGAITDESVLKYIGAAMAILGQLGYTAQRGFVKATEIKAEAAKVLGGLPPKNPS